jgi:hypothetical protein
MCFHVVNGDPQLPERPDEKDTGEDMTIPPVFSKSFYRKLAEYAKEFKTSRSAFAMKAIDYYAEGLRRKKSPAMKALGSDLAARHSELVGKVVKQWWRGISPEERTERAKKAIAARWAKKRAEEEKKHKRGK